jgi:O-antigen ligase
MACLIGIFALATFYADPGLELLKYVTAPYGAVPVGNYPRLAVGFPSASMFCNYLNVSLLFVLVAERKNWIGRKIFAALLLSILLCSVFTFSAGLGGVFLALGLWLWFVLKNEKPWAGRACIAAGVAIAIASYLLTLVALQPYSTAPYSIALPAMGTQIQPSPRILIWTEALRTFVDNFWTGAGIGAHAANVLFQNTDGTNSRLLDAHNIFLNIAAQTGIAGLIAVLALCVAVLRISIARTFSFVLYGLGVAFLCTFVYQGLTGSFEHARHLWVLMGMIIAADRIMRATKTLPQHEEGLRASHPPSAIEARSA